MAERKTKKIPEGGFKVGDTVETSRGWKGEIVSIDSMGFLQVKYGNGLVGAFPWKPEELRLISRPESEPLKVGDLVEVKFEAVVTRVLTDCVLVYRRDPRDSDDDRLSGTGAYYQLEHGDLRRLP